MLKLSILLQGLTLVLLGPACEASSLGMTVHVEPLDSDGGNTVRAHFSAISPNPCPALSGLCAEGEDCLVHTTSLPFNGTKPNTGWCVRQWQKTVPSNYSDTINLGSNTELYVSIKADPQVRSNSRLNQPAFVALPPPLRARVNCPHHFHLSVKDLDGDKVRCRFAKPDEGECVNCIKHSFIELEKDKCMLTFTGKAPAGQYFIYLMAEDMIPGPKISHVTENKPLSSVPVHLSLTVEESTFKCSDEPVATGDTPKEDTTMFVMPYQQVQFNVNYTSQLESALEVAVVGPPELYRNNFRSVGSMATMSMAWVRSENKLARLLPICFVVNTMSLQSEPRCVWLYQRQMKMLPAGTELSCENTEMTLVLPLDSLRHINLTELQLNSPTCPVNYNSTHLTARISLTGCGTTIVHSGSELVYTNTLKSVRPYTMVNRKPSLVLPLACRIPAAEAKGPQYQITLPTERETFGDIRVWLKLYLPGEGPLSEFTRNPKFRTRFIRDRTSTDKRGAIGSRLKNLDLHVMSNCSIDKAEMIVSNCIESETEDFAVSHPILDHGCTTSNSTLEIITTKTNSKVYRLDLSSLETTGSTMYVQCTVNLCIATMPSEKCPDPCTRATNRRSVVSSLFTSSYTISSGAVSLVVTTPQPAATIKTTTMQTTSHAPELRLSVMAAGMIVTTISVFLQNIFLY